MTRKKKKLVGGVSICSSGWWRQIGRRWDKWDGAILSFSCQTREQFIKNISLSLPPFRIRWDYLDSIWINGTCMKISKGKMNRSLFQLSLFQLIIFGKRVPIRRGIIKKMRATFFLSIIKDWVRFYVYKNLMINVFMN